MKKMDVQDLKEGRTKLICLPYSTQ